jgi:hypothetical protein
MNKEEAKEKLRKKQSELRQAEIVMEMHENGVRELREDIEKLKAIINKKDDWKLVEVPDNLQELYREKAYLMADMMRFVYAKNEGWMPDWGDDDESKWGIAIYENKCLIENFYDVNYFIFGIAVKSEEIAQEMLAEFGGRIKDIYNKQY